MKCSVVWLSGVRRAGKTFLYQSLPKIEYFDCELPRVRKLMEGPQSFLDTLHGCTVALDLFVIITDGLSYGRKTRVICGNTSYSMKYRQYLQTRKVQYWRDKRNHEIDFVLSFQKNAPTAVECKLTQSEFDAQNMISFRRQYPVGENFVVTNDVDHSLFRKYNGVTVRFVNVKHLIKALKEHYLI